MQLILASNDRPIHVDATSPLGRGGEASIYRATGAEMFVAKIYSSIRRETEDKLRAMIQNPPHDPTSDQGRVSVAWPVDLLYAAGDRAFAGYLMHFVPESATKQSPLNKILTSLIGALCGDYAAKRSQRQTHGP